ncbi:MULTISPECIES: DUF6578 domain-containing protein [unclassified Streptomyces]|uniref:DUF6578 domain-containing protein n=1 Tax=unclassified Streptomyces TaxID=2593676 RepID=UPI002E12B75E|nr:hypothetical protein OG452_26075 [Streptomyces sp. NBC_01197]WSS48739.1 hypothetical protein OG708_08775 [Streptomyces sp. NBC_01180]
MTVWQVVYADWEMECCGTPFSVGDEVTWTVGPYGGVGPGLPGGTLCVSNHGMGGPLAEPLTARVRSIRVVTEEFAETPDGSGCEPVPGRLALRSVRRCPKWFSREADGAGGPGHDRRATGVLVELERPGG